VVELFHGDVAKAVVFLGQFNRSEEVIGFLFAFNRIYAGVTSIDILCLLKDVFVPGFVCANKRLCVAGNTVDISIKVCHFKDSK